MKFLQQLKTAFRFVAGTLIVSAVAIAIGVIGLRSLRETNLGLETVYNARVVPLQQLKAIADDANRRNVSSTPSFVINDKVFAGGQSLDELKKNIASAVPGATID